ncbi:MAG: DUF433 domain-containing protein [Anaerolineae bacterium]|nr:DUF433 domain-containing protein [Anaerolineae bacterium]
MTIHSIDTIVSDTRVRGGHPIIAGTRLRVADLVASHIYRGLTPDELAVNYALDLGQVYAALAYYYQHKTAMDDQRRADVVRAEQLLADSEAQKRLIRVG